MSYRDLQLGAAINQHFAGQPPSGIHTYDGVLTAWPVSAGPAPTDADLAQWVADYLAYRQTTQCQDDQLQAFLDSPGGKVAKTIAGVLIDKGICTFAELRAKYRSLP